jgi:hypothetical protein
MGLAPLPVLLELLATLGVHPEVVHGDEQGHGDLRLL